MKQSLCFERNKNIREDAKSRETSFQQNLHDDHAIQSIYNYWRPLLQLLRFSVTWIFSYGYMHLVDGWTCFTAQKIIPLRYEIFLEPCYWLQWWPLTSSYPRPCDISWSLARIPKYLIFSVVEIYFIINLNVAFLLN